MNIFFDLDGTLLDSRDRLYRLFQHLVPASTFSFDDYWALKRQGIGHSKILNTHFSYTPDDIAGFEKSWLDAIELTEWLSLDKPFEGITEYLRELKTKHQLHLVTARQSEMSVLHQVVPHGWDQIFDNLFVTCQKQDKYELIKSFAKEEKIDWFVGDTGKDIQTGKQIGANTVAVLSGFLSREVLQRYEPDMIIENVLDLKTILS